jgi:predicted nucleic acid-binding protein
VSDVAYFEPSALVKLAVVEEESAALHGALDEWPRRVSSRLSVVEVLRSVRRRDAAQEPLARQVLARLHLVVISDRILAHAARLEPVNVRSIDAIHVATALTLGESLRAFVSYDGRQLAAATEVGLPVVSPR